MITEKCLPKMAASLNGITTKKLKTDEKELVGNFKTDEE